MHLQQRDVAESCVDNVMFEDGGCLKLIGVHEGPALPGRLLWLLGKPIDGIELLVRIDLKH